MKCLKMLTFLPIETINDMESWEDSRINEKKEILAYELTALVHGKDEAQKALDTAKAIFSGSGDSENMPTALLNINDFENGEIGIVALAVKCGFAQSNGEAKRLIQQNGITVNDNIAKIQDKYSAEDVKQGLIIKKGKKHFRKTILQ